MVKPKYVYPCDNAGKAVVVHYDTHCLCRYLLCVIL